MKKCIALIDRVNTALGKVSGLCVAAASVLIIVEIGSRAFFGRSLQVTDEYTGYLMAVSSFLGLGYVEQTHGHIRMDLIDLLRAKFPRFIRACRLWAYGMALVFAGYLTCVGWRLFYQSYVYGSKSMQISETPLIIPQAFIPLGAAVLFLQYLCNACKYCSGQSER
ncbi:MAG: TRAP transporter small permease [Deltaproteobacteria bacterium]|nr:TRAP transporter small permease [Deltaproteobacteria bacterium]